MDTVKSVAKNPIIRFLDNASYFRFFFLFILFCDIPIPIIPDAVWIAPLVWSLYLFIKKLIICGYIKKIRYRRIMYLFLVGGLVTILTRQDNLVQNLIMLYWVAVCFFLFFGLYSEKSHRKNMQEFSVILNFIVYATTAVMIGGLIMLGIFPKGINIGGATLAIFEDRFTGLLTNANIIAFYTLVAAVGAHILWKIKKVAGELTTKIKVIYIICIAINILSLFLSDSNAGIVFLIVYVCFVVFYKIFRTYKKDQILSFIVRFVATALACVIATVGLIYARTLTQRGVSLMLTAGTSNSYISNSITTENGQLKIKSDSPTEPTTTFSHQNPNIDSGRFDVWKQALRLIENFPLLGIGPANIVHYGDIYLGGLKYGDIHNGLLTILVSFGLVGFSIFMVLAFLIASALTKSLFIFRDKCFNDGCVPVYITAFCAAYSVYSMFEVALLLNMSYRVLIFWVMIAYGLSFVTKYEREYRIEQALSDKSFSQAELEIDPLAK